MFRCKDKAQIVRLISNHLRFRTTDNDPRSHSLPHPYPTPILPFATISSTLLTALLLLRRAGIPSIRVRRGRSRVLAFVDGDLDALHKTVFVILLLSAIVRYGSVYIAMMQRSTRHCGMTVVSTYVVGLDPVEIFLVPEMLSVLSFVVCVVERK